MLSRKFGVAFSQACPSINHLQNKQSYWHEFQEKLVIDSTLIFVGSPFPIFFSYFSINLKIISHNGVNTKVRLAMPAMPSAILEVSITPQHVFALLSQQHTLTTDTDMSLQVSGSVQKFDHLAICQQVTTLYVIVRTGISITCIPVQLPSLSWERHMSVINIIICN